MLEIALILGVLSSALVALSSGIIGVCFEHNTKCAPTTVIASLVTLTLCTILIIWF